MLNRIKRAYRAFIAPERPWENLQHLVDDTTTDVFLPDGTKIFRGTYANPRAQLVEIIGDGKAEFLGEGSEEEYREQVNEDKGWKGIFGIGK